MTGKGKSVFLVVEFVTSVQFAVSSLFLCVCGFPLPCPLLQSVVITRYIFIESSLKTCILCSFISVL